MKITISRAVLCIVFLVAALTAASAYGQEDYIVMEKNRVVKTYDFSEKGELSVKNISGDIRVESWNKKQIEIEIVKKGRRDDIEVYIDRRKSTVDIEVDYPQYDRRYWDRHRGSGTSIYFNIKLPSSAHVDLSSVSGDIWMKDFTADVEANSVSGDVEGENILGDIYAKSVSGRVMIENASGEIEAHSVSGDIEIRRSKCTDMQAKTVSGNIELETEVISERGRYRCTTHSGDIRFYIPGTAKASIRVRARNRNFISDFKLDNDDNGRDSRRSSKRSWRYDYNVGPRLFSGEINGGGGRIDLSTFSGDIELNKK